MAKKKDIKTGPAESPDPGQETAEVQGWQQAISTTEQWRRLISEKAKWETFVQEYGGDWSHVSSTLDIQLLPINLVFAYVKTEIARLYFRDPYIAVNAKRIEDLGAAKIAEQLINYVWGELNLKDEIKKALLDALLVGHGWIKMGYTGEFGVLEYKPEDTKGKEKEVMTSEYVKEESVFAYHVPYKDVLFAPDSVNPPHDSRWVAFRIEKPLRAVKESKLYQNTEDLKPMERTPEDMKTPGYDGRVQKVLLYEIWDMDHKQVVTISPTCDKYLRKVPWPYQKMRGYPLVMFGFNKMPAQPYPISDIAPWEPQVVELMKMMAIMTNHLKRWNRQIFVKEGFMTDDEMKKFTRGVDGAIIKYMGNAGTDMFIPPYAAVQQDIYGIWNLIMGMWRNVSGQSEIDRGAPAESTTRTLGELRMQMQGGRARSDEKVDVLEDQISEVARKLLSIMKQYMTIPKIVRIVGQKSMDEALKKAMEERPSSQAGEAVNGQDMFSVNGIDLPEDPDVDTVAGSTVPLNKENKLKMMTELTPILQGMGIQPGSMASIEWGSEVLREVDIKSVDRIIEIAKQDLAQTQAQQQQMLQMQQQQAQQQQQADSQAQQQQGQTQAQIEQVRLGTETVRAQAQKQQSEIDLIQAGMKLKEAALGHVQKMSGVHDGNVSN